MRTKILLAGFFATLIPHISLAQENSVHGTILNSVGEPLGFATAVLLDPSDSTLMYYAISNEKGGFEIKSASAGPYLLQVAFIGYKTVYKNVQMPVDSKSPFVFVMEEKSLELDEVEVVGEAIPLLVNGDTIEYKRGAYKLQEGSVVEDLLKKLPGVEVDRAGNIKAMGEDVRQVYVDGKEFFGNDPKLATKNLPADAVDKVQMFDKKSDDAEFTGVDDGSRQKALNLLLEEDMKNIIFGNVAAGGGLPSVYEGKMKSFYRNDKIAIAALGNLNNINNPGFSLGDYMSFQNGGSYSFTSGSFNIGNTSNLPVNFGQPVYGNNSSEAGGLNLSYATDKYNRFYVSYMASHIKRELLENIYSRNYTDDSNFEKETDSDESRSDIAQIASLGLKRRPDSTTSYSLNLNLNINHGDSERNDNLNSNLNAEDVNQMLSESFNLNTRKGISGSGSFTELIKPGATILKLNTKGNYTSSTDLSEIMNSTTFFNPFETITTNQFQENRSENLNYSGSIGLVQKAGRVFLEPIFKISENREQLNRKQGIPGETRTLIDSLSPEANKSFFSLIPGVGIRINDNKNTLKISLSYQFSALESRVNKTRGRTKNFRFILPSLDYERKISSGKRISVDYRTIVSEPSLLQLLPVVNTLNPLYRVEGNPGLEPEYSHRLSSNLFIFDQFSFTSFFASLRAGYIQNQISLSRNIDENLIQTLRPVNLGDGLELSVSADLSTPIRKLGIKLHFSAEETFRQGTSLVNGLENEFSSQSNDLVLSFDNRVKKKWDLRTGFGFRLTHSKYSIREDLNDRYFDLNWFGEVAYTAGRRFDIEFSADIVNYNRQSFEEEVVIPYLKAEVNYHFPKSRRATIQFSVNDILNRDQGIQRISELNYLSEIRRNILGRYAMLSIIYKLNKTENQGVNIHVESSGRNRR